MSTQMNRTIVRRAIEEIVNQGNLALIDELVGSDYVYHAAGIPELRGTKGFRQMVSVYSTAFPDLRLTIQDQIAEGDKVVTRLTISGTNHGELMGIPPTGKQASVAGILISRIANGKIVEEWDNVDTLGMLQQLGIAPVPGQAS